MNRFQYIIIIILVLITAVAIYGVYVLQQGNKEKYILTRQQSCIDLGEKKKEEISKDNHAKRNDILIKTGKYIYTESIDGCIFEESITMKAGSESLQNYRLINLFGGKVINQVTWSLSSGEEENAVQNCQIYNDIRDKYFDDKLNCTAYKP